MKRKLDNFTQQEINEIVKNSKTFKEVAIAIGYAPKGAGSGTISSMLKDYFDTNSIDYSHFLTSGWAKKDYTSSNTIKSNYLRTHEHKCALCGIGEEWNGKFLTLQLHHIDGNRNNNTDNNLCLLCPNCHSQTDNFTGKNKKNFQKPCKVSDEEFLAAIKKHNGNIRQACLELNISTGGQNYQRARALLDK